jgi:hypothetical protein
LEILLEVGDYLREFDGAKRLGGGVPEEFYGTKATFTNTADMNIFIIGKGVGRDRDSRFGHGVSNENDLDRTGLAGLAQCYLQEEIILQSTLARIYGLEFFAKENNEKSRTRAPGLIGGSHGSRRKVPA